MTLFQPAVKESLRARVAIDGPTGSGKTWTALQWARILAGPDGAVGVIDTENRSAAYYAPTPGVEVERINPWSPPYEFGHLPVSPPYSPIALREMIQAAGAELGADGVLVIDSLTHFWNGEGGTLDIVDDASSRGNSFTGWKEGTPAQRAMLDAIIHAPCHVIVTMRSKMEYLLVEEVKNGKKISVPTKVGMAPEQRSGVEYEFTVVADMDLEHRLVVSKSRCDLISDLVVPKGRSHEPAHTFAAWLGTGVTRVSTDEVKALVDLVSSIADEEAKAEVKAAFQVRFGPSRELTSDKYPLAVSWLQERIAAVSGAATAAGPASDPVAADPVESDAAALALDVVDMALAVGETAGLGPTGEAAGDAVTGNGTGSTESRSADLAARKLAEVNAQVAAAARDAVDDGDPGPIELLGAS